MTGKPVRKPVRVALIGPGQHAQENLLPALRLDPRCRLAVICSRDAGRAAAAAEKWGADRSATDWRAVLDPATVDAVVVSAAPELHSAVALAAIKVGVGAYLEKPPAPDSAILDAIIAAAAGTAMPPVVGYNLLHAGPYRSLRRLITAEGGARHVRIRCLANKPRNPLWSLELFPSLLYAIGIHALSVAGDLCPDLNVEHHRRHDLQNGLLSTTMLLSNDRGQSVSVECGNFANRFVFEVEVITANGAVVSLNDLSTLAAFGGTAGAGSPRLGPKAVETHHPGNLREPFFYSGYGAAIGEFLEGVANGACDRGTLDLSRGLYRIIDACLASDEA